MVHIGPRTPERYNAPMTRRPAARAAPRRKSAQGPAAQQLIPAILTPARKREIAGATLLAVGVLTLVSFVSNRGQVTAAWVAFLGRLMGDGRWLLPLLLGGTGAWLLVDSMDDQVELRLARPAGADLHRCGSSPLRWRLAGGSVRVAWSSW